MVQDKFEHFNVRNYYLEQMKRKVSDAGLKTGRAKTTKRKKVAPQQLTRQVNTVRGGPEKKNIDQSAVLSITNATITGFISSLLTPIAQGSTANSRLGRKVRLTKVTLRWNAYLSSASAQGSPLRVKMIYDKQTNGAAPTAADVLQSDSMISPNNLDNSDRFITLMDFLTEPLSVNNNYSVSGQVTKNIDLEQIWLGGTATGVIGSLLTGSCYLFVWQNGQIVTASANFSYYCRFRFLDN